MKEAASSADVPTLWLLPEAKMKADTLVGLDLSGLAEEIDPHSVDATSVFTRRCVNRSWSRLPNTSVEIHSNQAASCTILLREGATGWAPPRRPFSTSHCVDAHVCEQARGRTPAPQRPWRIKAFSFFISRRRNHSYPDSCPHHAKPLA